MAMKRMSTTSADLWGSILVESQALLQLPGRGDCVDGTVSCGFRTLPLIADIVTMICGTFGHCDAPVVDRQSHLESFFCKDAENAGRINIGTWPKGPDIKVFTLRPK